MKDGNYEGFKYKMSEELHEHDLKCTFDFYASNVIQINYSNWLMILSAAQARRSCNTQE